MDLALADRDARQRDPVRVRRQIEVVADVYGRDQESEFLGQLLANALDTRHQRAIALRIDQRNQSVTNLEADQIDGIDVLPATGPAALPPGLWLPARLRRCPLASAQPCRRDKTERGEAQETRGSAFPGHAQCTDNRAGNSSVRGS